MSNTNPNEFQTVTRKRARNSPSNANTSKKSKAAEVTTTYPLFIKGEGFNIAKEATGHPIAFKRNLTEIIGNTGEIRVSKESIRVTCLNQKQKSQLLNTKDFNRKPISVTEPWTKRPHSHNVSSVGDRPAVNSNSSTKRKGIIFGVPVELTEFEIAQETKAYDARRIRKYTNNRNEPTGNVVLTFEGSLPPHVYLGFMRRQVKEYIPQPMRCTRCQAFGHREGNCRRQVRCVRCGNAHKMEDCPIKDKPEEAVCVNCKGRHSAAYKGCSKYQEVSQTLKVAVTQKVSYRDALVKVRNAGVRLQETSQADIVVHRPPAMTSTPLPQRTPRSRRVRVSSETGARRQLNVDTPPQPAASGSTEPQSSTSDAQMTAAAPAEAEATAPRHHTCSTSDIHKQIIQRPCSNNNPL